jgi:hypothetical protein
MAFNVQNMLSSLNKTGVAKTSHFEVQITGYGTSGEEEGLMGRADTAEIPGRSLMTAEHKFSNYGPMNKVPYGGQTYTDTTISFIMSEDMREKEYFEIWQNRIVNTGAFEVGSTQGDLYGYVQSKFNPHYFDDYLGTVIIRQYGSAGSLNSIYTLNEAYPIMIAPISMSWGTEDLAKLSVTFAYRNYKCVFNKTDQPGLGLGFSFSIGPNGIAGSARLPGIGTISTANLGGLKTVNAKIDGITNRVAQIRKSF